MIPDSAAIRQGQSQNSRDKIVGWTMTDKVCN